MAEDCRPVICPKCADTNPAVTNRSDGVTNYRCDRCNHLWALATRPGEDSELPPLPAIGATGG